MSALEEAVQQSSICMGRPVEQVGAMATCLEAHGLEADELLHLLSSLTEDLKLLNSTNPPAQVLLCAASCCQAQQACSQPCCCVCPSTSCRLGDSVSSMLACNQLWQNRMLHACLQPCLQLVCCVVREAARLCVACRHLRLFSGAACQARFCSQTLPQWRWRDRCV